MSRGSVEAPRRAAPPAEPAEESEPVLDDEAILVQKRPVSKPAPSAADKSKYNRLKTVLKVEERDLHFNRSGTLAAEKFEWLEVKRKGEEEEEPEAREAEEELEARDEVEELEARAKTKAAPKVVARSTKGKSGRFVFDNDDDDENEEQLSGGIDSGVADPPENADAKGGVSVLRQLKGVLRNGARAMEVREPSEWGDDDDMHQREMTSARDMESGAEPVSARAPIGQQGPFDEEEALDSPVARNVRLGTLKVRTAAALGADRGAARAGDVKKPQTVTSEKLAEKEAVRSNPQSDTRAACKSQEIFSPLCFSANRRRRKNFLSSGSLSASALRAKRGTSMSPCIILVVTQSVASFGAVRCYPSCC